MVKLNSQEVLTETYNRLIKNAFNAYVRTMNDNNIPEEHKLLNTIYDLGFFIENAQKCYEELRNHLNLEMQENGIISYKSDKAKATLVKATQSAQIINVDKIAECRPDLMVASEIRPDRTEIAKLLRKGEVIQGAVLSNGGPPVLKITAIKNKTNPYAKGVEENV